jgi:hypothetical protein
MALSLSTHTTYPGTNPVTISVPLPAWGNWVVDDTINEKNTLYLMDTTAPTTSPRRLKLQRRVIQNMYQNSDIATANRAIIKKAFILFGEYTSIWDETDSVDSTYDVKLPLKVSFQVVIPQNDLITESLAMQLVAEGLQPFYTTAGLKRIAKWISGSLNPNN